MAADRQDDPRTPKRPRRRRYGWWLFWGIVVAGGVALGVAVAMESRSSRLQAREFSRFAANLSYSMQPGPGNEVIYPGDGPFDKRLGYSSLDEFLPRLLKRDYVITRQTRFSPELRGYVQRGFFVPYEEKARPGCRSLTAGARRCMSFVTRSSCIRRSRTFRHWWSTACCSSRTAICWTRSSRWPTRPWTGHALPRQPGRKWQRYLPCPVSPPVAVRWRLSWKNTVTHLTG